MVIFNSKLLVYQRVSCCAGVEFPTLFPLLSFSAPLAVAYHSLVSTPSAARRARKFIAFSWLNYSNISNLADHWKFQYQKASIQYIYICNIIYVYIYNVYI